MAWQRPIDPAQVYEQWEYVAAIFDPGRGFEPGGELAGAAEAAIALLTARQSAWAAMCLSVGYASRTDGDAGLVVVDLARASGDSWASSEITSFSETYANLGWEPQALVSSARVISKAVPLPLVSAVGNDIGTLELCLSLHNGDSDAVLACLRQANAALAEPAA
jgi:hypothetical protein